MKRTFDPLALADLAAEQWGLLTTAQAGAVGVSAQQVARMSSIGILERLRHGVYRLAGNPPASLDNARAAWLALDPAMTVVERLTRSQPGVVSHRTAAQLHGLGDLDADVIEFTVGGRKQSRSSDVRFHVDADLQRSEWAMLDGLPVTTIETTIGQLAAERLDGGHLAGVVRDALVTHHLSIEVITVVLRPYAHHYGVPLGAGAELLDLFLDQAGIPETTRRIGAQAEYNDDLAGLAAAFARMPLLHPARGAAVSTVVANPPLVHSSVTAAFLAAAAKETPTLDPALITGQLVTPQVKAHLAAPLRDTGQPRDIGSTPAGGAFATIDRPGSSKPVAKDQREASKPARS